MTHQTVFHTFSICALIFVIIFVRALLMKHGGTCCSKSDCCRRLSVFWVSTSILLNPLPRTPCKILFQSQMHKVWARAKSIPHKIASVSFISSFSSFPVFFLDFKTSEYLFLKSKFWSCYQLFHIFSNLHISRTIQLIFTVLGRVFAEEPVKCSVKFDLI